MCLIAVGVYRELEHESVRICGHRGQSSRRSRRRSGGRAERLWRADDGGRGMVSDLAVLAEGVNLLWVLVVTFLIFFMHAGFAMLEAGQVRSKNVANQLTKNLLTWSIGVLAFFLVGAALSNVVGHLTGAGGAWSVAGEFGSVLAPTSVNDWVSWLFGAVFAMTAATIVSGAVAGRCKLRTYVAYTVLLAAVIYPVVVGFKWGGGVLATLGFHDFAGGMVVHGMGGIAGLTAAWVIGPRLGRFDEDGSANVIPGHSLPFAVLGTLILAFGWFGFNVGTAVEVFTVSDGGQLALSDYGYAGRVALNTALVMGAGTIGAAAVSVLRSGKVDSLMTANGLLAGLVSVCSIAAVASWPATLVVGFIAGVQVVLVFDLLEKFGIDDVCAVFPVHGSAGALSALAYPFVNTTSAFSISQLGVQAVGVVVLAAWAAGITFAVYGGLKAVGWARVSHEEELEGLDASEHGVETYPEFGQQVAGGGAAVPGPDTPTATDGGREATDDD